MILTRDILLEKIKKKEIQITPYSRGLVGPASIDLTLDNKIRIFNGKEASADDKTDYKKITKIVDISKGYTLKPGELVVGITMEKIKLPGNLCGWLNSRSRYARIGLMSHITAPFVAPGVSNKQVLEMYNASPNNIMLLPKSKICQIVLEECRGKAKYSGIWKNQRL